MSSQCASCLSSKAVAEVAIGGRVQDDEYSLQSGSVLSGGADGGWGCRVGRVRRAHGRPYPLSCFMAMVLNGGWTSITAARHSEPSDSGGEKEEGWGVGVRNRLCVEGRVALLLIFHHLSLTAQNRLPSGGHVADHVQHIGSQMQLGSGIPMVPLRAEEKRQRCKNKKQRITHQKYLTGVQP